MENDLKINSEALNVIGKCIPKGIVELLNSLSKLTFPINDKDSLREQMKANALESTSYSALDYFFKIDSFPLASLGNSLEKLNLLLPLEYRFFPILDDVNPELRSLPTLSLDIQDKNERVNLFSPEASNRYKRCLENVERSLEFCESQYPNQDIAPILCRLKRSRERNKCLTNLLQSFDPLRLILDR